MSKNRIYVIYVPGIGDNRTFGQRLAIYTWRLWGVKAELCLMTWNDMEPWETKLGRLIKRIDSLNAEHRKVALVGASAGASAVINAYALRKDKIIGCILIAGKVNHPESIGGRYLKNEPAFVKSVNQCQSSLKSLDEHYRKRILSLYSPKDTIVANKDSHIDGAINRKVTNKGHFLTIAYQIFIGARSFLKFIKELN